jgi:hypothetical protein
MKFVEVRNAETEDHLFINPDFIAIVERADRGRFRLSIVMGTAMRTVLVDRDDADRVLFHTGEPLLPVVSPTLLPQATTE